MCLSGANGPGSLSVVLGSLSVAIFEVACQQGNESDLIVNRPEMIVKTAKMMPLARSPLFLLWIML